MPIHIWDTATGRSSVTGRRITAVASASRRTAATVATVGRQVIRFWEVASGREIRPQSGSHHSAIGAAAFTPDGRSIVTAGHDRTIRFWDPATGREVRQLEKSDASLNFIISSADGKTMASGYGSSLPGSGMWPPGVCCAGFRLPANLTISLSPVRTSRRTARRWPRPRTTAVILWDTATGKGRAGVAKSPLVPKLVTKLVKALRFAAGH